MLFSCLIKKQRGETDKVKTKPVCVFTKISKINLRPVPPRNWFCGFVNRREIRGRLGGLSYVNDSEENIHRYWVKEDNHT